MELQRRTKVLAVMLLLISIGLTACESPLSRSNGGVTSTILSNTHVDPLPVNQELIITSDHRSKNGIREVQFKVNGHLIDTQTKKPPFPDTQFITEHRWSPPDAEKYTISIVAFDNQNNQATTTIKVVAEAGIIPVATRVKAEQTREAPTRAPIGEEIACLNTARLVTDVTIPDGSQIDPGAVFNKTWRIQNSGTCNWPAGYTFVHVAGPTLGGTNISLQALTAGGEVDITIPMQAPAGGGTYRSDWQIKDQNNLAFGPIFRAEIVVPGTCEGPKINQFAANPPEINAGDSSTLTWQVEGATTITLNPGPQLSGDSGSASVSPSNTTTYILEARSGDCTATQTLTVTVKPVTGKPAGPTDLRVAEVGQTRMLLTWQDVSDNEVQFQLFEADTNTHRFTYSANAEEGQADGLDCNTTYRWQLYAINGQGLSEPSNIVESTTNACN